MLMIMFFAAFIFFPNSKISSIEYYPASPYLISTFGRVLFNNKEAISPPFKITKGDIIETIDESGALTILRNGIEIGLKNSAKIIFYDKNSIELINGEILAQKINDEHFIVKWKNIKLTITGKSDLKIVRNRRGKENLIFNSYKGKTKLTIYPSGEKRLLQQGFFYSIDENNNITPAKLLPQPVDLSPVDLKNIGIENGSNLLFKWKKIENAKGYILHTAYNSIFAKEKKYKTKTNFFRINIINFENSPVYWKVSALNKNGNEGELSKTNRFYIKNLIQILQLWKNPPKLQLTSPLSPTGNLLIIKGKTDLGVKLTINGEEVTVDSNGNFMHILSFNSVGEHEIIIVSKNLSGAETRLTKKVVIYEK